MHRIAPDEPVNMYAVNGRNKHTLSA